MKSPVWKVFMLLVAFSLCLASLAQPSRSQASQTGQAPPEQSETMYVYWFFLKPSEWDNGSSSGSWGVGWNVWLHVDNISTALIPLNLSSPAFNDGFEGVTFDAVAYGFKNQWLTLHASYSPMDVGLAENYTDIICSEFQEAFNLTAAVVGKTHTIDNQTGTITVYRNLGYFTETAEFMTRLEEYRPQGGFGQLITPNTITAYLDPLGSMQLYYSLARTDRGAFYWSFMTMFDGEEGPVKNGDYANLNLNELLNRTGEITPSAEGSSTIWVDVQDNDTAGGQFCSLTVENISPLYDSREDTDNVFLVTYNLKAPIDNIVATIKVTIMNEAVSPFQNQPGLAIAVTVVVALIFAVAIVARRRRRSKESASSETRQGSLSLRFTKGSRR